MHQYECEVCGCIAEIEAIEATFGHHEHYESNMCLTCFKKEYNNQEELQC